MDTDDKATPDLDAQWATAVAAARAQIKSYEAVTPGPCPAESLWDETSDMPEEVARVVSEVWLTALAAERDRADRFKQSAYDNFEAARLANDRADHYLKRLAEAEQRIVDAPHAEWCPSVPGYDLRRPHLRCACWKSEATG